MANKFTRLYIAETVASGDGKKWNKLSTTGQLNAPILSLNGNTLTITDKSGLATSFDLLVDGVVIGTATSDTFDLSALGINAFCTISAISKADKWVDSVQSLPVIYSIGTENAIVFSSSNSFTLGLAYSELQVWSGVINYSTDANNWKPWDGNAITAANGSLYLAGLSNTFITGERNRNASWVLTGSNISCSGNIENLLDCSVVANGEHPTMATACYENMFNDCTSLTTAPELPATTLADNCYYRMFAGCTGLTTAPELPATTLAISCYEAMFASCTGITTAPELPATTLAESCYSGMFSGCTSLTTAPELPATILADDCYKYMFFGCTSLTTPPALPATTLAYSCYEGMFYGCTGLIVIPELPATTLEAACYYWMFFECSSLKLSTEQTDEYQTAYRIPTSGTGTTATLSLDGMFDYTGGTFTDDPEINTTYYLHSSNSVV